MKYLLLALWIASSSCLIGACGSSSATSSAGGAPAGPPDAGAGDSQPPPSAPPPDAGPVCEAAAGHTCYYVSAHQGSGSGTLADPYGLADLPDPTQSYCPVTGPALGNLQPGDYLYFRQGTYTFVGCAGYYNAGYIRPARSGTAGNPITFKAYPGEEVVLTNDNGGQPPLGNDGKSYVRFQGFTVNTGSESGIRLVGANNVKATNIEVAYNHFVGVNEPQNTDNHECVRIEDVDAAWVHHNEIEGMTGNGENNAGVKMYRASNAIVELNYIHDNFAGVFDKESGSQNTYRFNYFVRNKDAWNGNNQGTPLLAYIYENVFDMPISLHYLGDGIEVHDNLVLHSTGLAGEWAGQVYHSKVWNNVVLSNGAGAISAYSAAHERLAGTNGQDQALSYMDYNFYDATPGYKFNYYGMPVETLTLADMRAAGFEAHAQVVPSGASLYVDLVSYQLQPAYETAGRNGDPIGPDDVAGILDLKRYGPHAQP